MPSVLTVFIIAYNSEKKIEACLKSVQWADEIIVVDSFSSDRTAELSRKLGARVYNREFKNYADQKNYALSLVQTPWALSLDSDEAVSGPLKEEILRALASNPEAAAYRIPRESFIFGRKFRFTGTQDDAPVRLLRAGRARFEQPVHEVVKVEGDTGKLSNPIFHFTYDSVEDYLSRLNRYTGLEAAYLKSKNTPLSWRDFFLRPTAVFFRLYILKQGFRDGMEGFFFSAFSAFYTLIKYAKYRELGKNGHAAA